MSGNRELRHKRAERIMLGLYQAAYFRRIIEQVDLLRADFE